MDTGVTTNTKTGTGPPVQGGMMTTLGKGATDPEARGGMAVATDKGTEGMDMDEQTGKERTSDALTVEALIIWPHTVGIRNVCASRVTSPDTTLDIAPKTHRTNGRERPARFNKVRETDGSRASGGTLASY